MIDLDKNIYGPTSSENELTLVQRKTRISVPLLPLCLHHHLDGADTTLLLVNRVTLTWGDMNRVFLNKKRIWVREKIRVSEMTDVCGCNDWG